MCASKLRLFDLSKPFKVEIDTINYTMDIVLYQDRKPITFESMKLDSTQCQWST